MVIMLCCFDKDYCECFPYFWQLYCGYHLIAFEL